MEMIINKNEKKIIPITKWKMRVTILFLILLFGISTPCITKQSESQEMQCFLRHCYDDFKESFKFYCVSSFIISLIIVIQYLYKNW